MRNRLALSLVEPYRASKAAGGKETVIYTNVLLNQAFNRHNTDRLPNHHQSASKPFEAFKSLHLLQLDHGGSY